MFGYVLVAIIACGVLVFLFRNKLARVVSGK